jgi:hypothetical protein
MSGSYSQCNIGGRSADADGGLAWHLQLHFLCFSAGKDAVVGIVVLAVKHSAYMKYIQGIRRTGRNMLSAMHSTQACTTTALADLLKLLCQVHSLLQARNCLDY